MLFCLFVFVFSKISVLFSFLFPAFGLLWLVGLLVLRGVFCLLFFWKWLVYRSGMCFIYLYALPLCETLSLQRSREQSVQYY